MHTCMHVKLPACKRFHEHIHIHVLCMKNPPLTESTTPESPQYPKSTDTGRSVPFQCSHKVPAENNFCSPQLCMHTHTDFGC